MSIHSDLRNQRRGQREQLRKQLRDLESKAIDALGHVILKANPHVEVDTLDTEGILRNAETLHEHKRAIVAISKQIADITEELEG